MKNIKKFYQKFLKNRYGDDMVSLLISMGITGITIVSLTMIITNSYLSMNKLSTNAKESQDMRNVSGIINRYSDLSSNILSQTGSSGEKELIFDNRTRLTLTSSGCENHGLNSKRFEYYYNNLTLEGVGLTSCYSDIETNSSTVYKDFDLKILRYRIKIGNNYYYNTVTAKS